MSYSGDALTLVIFPIPLISTDCEEMSALTFILLISPFTEAETSAAPLISYCSSSSAALLSSSSLNDFASSFRSTGTPSAKLIVPESLISLPSLRAVRSTLPEGLPSKTAFPFNAVNFILLYPTFEGAISIFPTNALSGPFRSASNAVMLPLSIDTFSEISCSILSVQSAKRRFFAATLSSRYFPGVLVSIFIVPASDDPKTLLSSKVMPRTPSSYFHFAETSSKGILAITALFKTPSPVVKMSFPSPFISMLADNVPITPYFEIFGNIEAIFCMFAFVTSALRSGTGHTLPDIFAEPSSSLAEKPSSTQLPDSFFAMPYIENGIFLNFPFKAGASHSRPRSSSELSSSSRSPHFEETFTLFSIILSMGISLGP